MSEPLSPCPAKPNCVCSRDDARESQRIAPLALAGDPTAAFQRLKALVAAMDRTTVLTETDDYVHAACRTRLGFVDDLELRLAPDGRNVHMRSASRIGHWDLGANRRRVERLRSRFGAESP